MRVFSRSLTLLTLTLLLGMSATNIAYAQGKPVHTQIVTAGPYKVSIGLSAYPPIVGNMFDVTVQTVQGSAATPLSGRLTAQPGLGTDAIPEHATFAKAGAILDASIHLEVKGAWTLVVALNGPQGEGTASIDIIVSAPNAIPPWLGWLIGLSPLVGCAWLGWWLWHYRRKLIARQQSVGV